MNPKPSVRLPLTAEEWAGIRKRAIDASASTGDYIARLVRADLKSNGSAAPSAEKRDRAATKGV